MLLELVEKICNVFITKEKKNCKPNYNRYSNLKYVTKTIEFSNKNIVYPDHKTEKEIESLYSEIRESINNNRNGINKRKLTYNIQ